MIDDREAGKPVEAFILFNEHEDRVADIVDRLEQEGISTYFWRRDIRPGESWRDTEAEHVRTANSVLVFLGSMGWGPNHAELAAVAIDQARHLIPILIGEPPPEAMLEVAVLFEERRYVDLRRDDEHQFTLLVDEIKDQRAERLNDRRYDQWILKILDGNESERHEVLARIRRTLSFDRKALAERLVYEIEHRYGSPKITTFPEAPRPPENFASIRSWLLSCLIWTDPESEKPRRLIFGHLNPENEEDPVVRYWILAQLAAANVSYLKVASEICLTDPAPEVALVGRAIYYSPEDENLLRECRERLASSDLTAVWSVLRMLRVIPVPLLAPEVCALWSQAVVGTPEAYDSLFALCTPPMAFAAIPHLLESPGLDETMERIIGEAESSDPAMSLGFSVLVAALPKGAQWIQQRITIRSGDPGFDRIRRALESIEPDEDPRIMIPPYTPDTNEVGNDYLDIREDVQTLAAVMLAKEVPPPLAIGLFGDWGTGKSFFMGSLRKATEDFSSRNDPALCAHVVSIWFNAWHYAETNLHASMVEFILDKLADHVIPPKSGTEKRAALEADLLPRKLLVEVTTSQLKGATELLERHELELRDLRKEREEKRLTLRNLNAETLQELIASDKELASELEKAALDLGLPELDLGVEELAATLSDTIGLGNRLNLSIQTIAGSRHIWLIIPLLCVVLFVFPYLARWITELTHVGVVSQFSVIIAEVIAILGAATTALRRTNAKVRAAMNTFSRVKGRVDATIAKQIAEKSNEELDLEAKVAMLKSEKETAKETLETAIAEMAAAQKALVDLKDSLSLAHYILERRRSGDYQKHLSLISTIRRDFDELAERLKNPLESDSRFKPVDRIVLYIDDLDRCPARKILDVLEAVHLLLAYPIFVVVVGVDPRFLIRSLEQNFEALRPAALQEQSSSNPSYATPQDYLEKIFQIPFSLKPMSQFGYANLIGNLLAPSREESRDEKAVQLPARGPVAERETLLSARPLSSVAPESPERLVSSEPLESVPREGATFVQNIDEHEGGVYREAMTIRLWETRFAERLFPLMPTPRAAKRFTNTYRILKAPLRPIQLIDFEGSEYAPGEFRVPMLLLAMTIGFSRECRSIFPDVWKEIESNGNPLNVLSGLSSRTGVPRIVALHSKIAPILIDQTFPHDPELYRYWLPRVTRFSFDLISAVEVGAYNALT